MPLKRRTWLLLLLLLARCACMSRDERLEMREKVREMFTHAYDSYMRYAFPHDELRPISATHTDSLVEIGATAPTRTGYNGVALTLIDSLDTLAVLGNAT